MSFGLDYVLLLENGKAYKLFSSGTTEPLGDWAGTVADLEKHYSAYRGSALRCGVILQRDLYRKNSGSFAGALGYKASCDTLKEYGVDYYLNVFKEPEADE